MQKTTITSNIKPINYFEAKEVPLSGIDREEVELSHGRCT